MTATGPIEFSNPREMRTINRHNGWDRSNALDVLDLVGTGPKRGRLARLRERLIANLTDMSAENTHRLRMAIAKPIQCGQGGEPSDDPRILPLGPMRMSTAGAIALVRLGIHPVAYAVLTAVTRLDVAVGDFEIGNTIRTGASDQWMHLDFQTTDGHLAWRTDTGRLTIRGAALPDTVMRALSGKPLTALVRHPLADLIDLPITHVNQATNLEVAFRMSAAQIKLREIDPEALAKASLEEDSRYG